MNVTVSLAYPRMYLRSRDLLEILLSCGVDINAADYDKRTALHLASSEGNIHVVQLLLDRGAPRPFSVA